jgi:hypothetical protein
LASSLRRRVEDLARREGRSLSQQAGRLIEQGIGKKVGSPVTTRGGERRALSGIFRGGQVPTLTDFREARARSRRQPREGWEERFREMARRGDDRMLWPESPPSSSFDEQEWEW